jgi:hypothetical protein
VTFGARDFRAIGFEEHALIFPPSISFLPISLLWNLGRREDARPLCTATGESG